MAIREIHAREYKVCEALLLLDEVFKGHLDWWRLEGGFTVEHLGGTREEEKSSSGRSSVKVVPAGWKGKNFIELSFYKLDTEWELRGGVIYHDQLPPVGRLVFASGVNRAGRKCLYPTDDFSRNKEAAQMLQDATGD